MNGNGLPLTDKSWTAAFSRPLSADLPALFTHFTRPARILLPKRQQKTAHFVFPLLLAKPRKPKKRKKIEDGTQRVTHTML
jgi:hypothetical protein